MSMAVNVTVATVAKCDECGQQVIAFTDEFAGWLVLTRDRQLVLCFDSWRCLASYAAAVAADEARERQEAADK